MRRIGATGIMEIATTISLKKNVQKLVMNVEGINLNTENSKLIDFLFDKINLN